MVIIGLGGFFFWQHGKNQFKAGYGKCMYDGAVLATEAGRQLNEILTRPIDPSDVDRLLGVNHWLRDEGDK